MHAVGLPQITPHLFEIVVEPEVVAWEIAWFRWQRAEHLAYVSNVVNAGLYAHLGRKTVEPAPLFCGPVQVAERLRWNVSGTYALLYIEEEDLMITHFGDPVQLSIVRPVFPE